MEGNTSLQPEARMQQDVELAYRNENIAVYWNSALCIHVGSCFMGLPEVFKPESRPWIEINMAEPEQIAEVVSLCPTGALTFERLDGGPQEPLPDETIILPQPNGPL